MVKSLLIIFLITISHISYAEKSNSIDLGNRQKELVNVEKIIDSESKKLDEFFHKSDLIYKSAGLLDTQVQYDKFLKLTKFLTRLENVLKKFFGSIHDVDNAPEALNAQQLDVMFKLFKHFVDVTEPLAELINSLNPFVKVSLTDYIDSSNEEGVQNHLLWGSIQLRLFESFLNCYQYYYNNKRLRRILESGSIDYEISRKEITNLLEKFQSKKYRLKLKKYVKNFLKKEEEIISEFPDNTSIIDLVDFINTVPAKKIILKETRWRRWGRKLKYFGNALVDSILRGTNRSIEYLSKLFGNNVGKVRWRKGRLYQNKELLEELYRTLKPLDIITEKTPFILTDFFIPGHFGHNAIWLGTKKQLVDIEMWDHPTVRPYQVFIEMGYNLIEAHRSGVFLKKLEDFMDVDEYAVIRERNILSEETIYQEIYRKIFQQIGKEYDFNFDVETTNKLVCSELIYQSLFTVNWKTEKILGRWTISPDNVVEVLFQKGSPLELVAYAKGNKRKKVIKKSIIDLANELSYRVINTDEGSSIKLEFEKVISHCTINDDDFENFDVLNFDEEECTPRTIQYIYAPLEFNQYDSDLEL